ncbi:MAG: hypothetical protein PHU18_03795, partial [Dehalococcoidales bacterium]|nr:hypothetical protein [Dehalococcoidales bacterium]
GGLYTASGRINIHNSAFKTQDRPIEEKCSCYTCRNFSAGYLPICSEAQNCWASGWPASIISISSKASPGVSESP